MDLRERMIPVILPEMPVIILGLIVFFSMVLSATTGFADEESCSTCDKEVQISGDFAHHKIRENVAVQGGEPGNESAFHEEIYGANFNISIAHLRAGKYTVAIGEAETFFNAAGQRAFDIACGNNLMVTNLDIFAKAGGMNKVFKVVAGVEHLDDSLNGPLTLTFTARMNQAKFNTVEVRDASGSAVISFAAADLADAYSATANKVPAVPGPELWRDPAQPVAMRVRDLTRRLSLSEKVQQVHDSTPAIPRLGIPAYRFWNEALHGVARSGVATVFPQAIGMAATWDVALLHNEADVIATEARAIHNHDKTDRYGLTFWSPNINIFRDPRWGRGQETYGEDPFLSGQLGVAFIRGLQGDDPKYFKAVACAKHYAVHSGPESKRHVFIADPPERDFYETYLPQFEAAVREGKVGAVMGAYNSVYGTPACANPLLLTSILRQQWGFDGYVVSDCGAIHDIFANHKFVSSPEAAAAAAVKAGCDICCGNDYNPLVKAVQKGLISETEIDGAAAYALKTRFRLGLFDPPAQVPWSKIEIDQNDTPEHEALALKVAEESIVLLKNDGTLPLNRASIKRLAVIGENADSVPVLVGNYNGTPARPMTILAGIKQAAGARVEITYSPGCPLALLKDGSNKSRAGSWDEAIAAATAADAVIYVGGISAHFEGEEMASANAFEGFAGGDRTEIELPAVQTDFLKQLQTTGKPVIFINCSGSAIAMPWEAENLPAIVQAWYPGEQGGRAVANVLFGDVDPAGRLPVTFYRSTGDLPDFEDYSMSNRTYRYFNGKPLFAFGHGLSYTAFSYQDAKLDRTVFAANDTVRVSFSVKNMGVREGDEVAQVYVRHLNSSVPQPRMALCGFARFHLAPGQSRLATIDIPAKQFRYWDVAQKKYVVEAGNYELLIGGASDDVRLKAPLRIVAGNDNK
jgi:beta-glucosidase